MTVNVAPPGEKAVQSVIDMGHIPADKIDVAMGRLAREVELIRLRMNGAAPSSTMPMELISIPWHPRVGPSALLYTHAGSRVHKIFQADLEYERGGAGPSTKVQPVRPPVDPKHPPPSALPPY